jgi:hypothetical protein
MHAFRLIAPHTTDFAASGKKTARTPLRTGRRAENDLPRPDDSPYDR